MASLPDDSKNFYTNGQVVCPGLSKCHIDHLDMPSSEQYPKMVSEVREAAGDMAWLQSARGAKMTSGSMQVAIKHLWDALPRDLGNRIRCEVSRPTEGLWDTEEWEPEDVRWMDRVVAHFSWTGELKGYEYLLWAFEVDADHWMLAAIHLVTDGAQVAQMAVFDAAVDEDAAHRMKVIQDQVETILHDVGGLKFSPSYRRKVWVPEQENPYDNSDGPRIFSICKETLRRILAIYETGELYHESLWNDHSGWFHEDTTRQEIIGAQAWHLVGGMDYKGRLAVEAVNAVRRDIKGEWEMPDTLMRPRPRKDDETLPRTSVKPRPTPLQALRRTPRNMHQVGLGKGRLPPFRSQPRIFPNFSMVKGDGLLEYSGWDDPSDERGPAWRDSAERSRPVLRQIPRPTSARPTSRRRQETTPGRFGSLGQPPGSGSLF